MEPLNALPLKLKESIEKIIQNEQFTSYHVEVKNISSKGANFMGYLHEININGKINKEDKEINIFAKSMVDGEEVMQIYSVKNVYNREMYTYNELMKIFEELQNDFDVPDEKKFNIVKSFDETNNENIILENLAKKGYKNYYRMDEMRLDFTVFAVKELAKLHGLSFALEKIQPEYFEKNIKPLEQPFYFNTDWDNYVMNMFEFSLKYLDEDVRMKYKNKLWTIVNKYPDYMKDKSSICTFVHGDYKMNNIMVRELNGVPTKVIAIDYQIMHYGSPVNDFLYLIFNGTDQEFRKNHLTHLKEVYHETMKEFLEYFQIEINEIFPRVLFEKLLNEKMDFGLAIQFFYIPFLFAAEDDVPDVTGDLGAVSFKVDDRYGTRLKGVIEDFIQWGYL
ncbi:hypothetical protein K1T71_005900 [Dendrolimus kikuchii]|uniref:Uncharacterized protein n=1 Tax=Dendrolimus kikuchii TaxID=765133 RepID=A0ACC1D3G5_9NEOP|nr:hypothetical protein K1T71_005900 [Dendrolimus kikuchii]